MFSVALTGNHYNTYCWSPESKPIVADLPNPRLNLKLTFLYTNKISKVSSLITA